MSNTKQERRETIKMCIVMMLTSLPEIISYYTGMGTMSQTQLRISMLLFVSVFSYVSLKKISKPGYVQFVIIFGWMLFISIFHLTPKMPIPTIFLISMLMVCGLLSKELPLKIINQSFSVLALLYSVVLLWQLSKANLDIGIILNRGYTWTEIFAYATLSSIWPICLFSAYLERRHVGIAIAITLMAIILNSISLKRSIFVEVGMAATIIGWISYKTKDLRTFRYILWIGIPLAIIGIYYVLNSSVGSEVTQVSEAISDRFSDTSDDMSSFDRFVESEEYFTQEANIIDIIMGKGFLSAHHSATDEHYFLHIGWTNFIFKGGIILLFMILAVEFRAWHIFLHPSKYDKETVFAAMYSVLSFFLLFFGNCMGFGPRLFFIFYCLMRVNDATKTKRVKAKTT